MARAPVESWSLQWEVVLCEQPREGGVNPTPKTESNVKTDDIIHHQEGTKRLTTHIIGLLLRRAEQVPKLIGSSWKKGKGLRYYCG